MLLSKDGKILVLGIPKTGTNTVSSVLMPNAVRLKSHANIDECFHMMRRGGLRNPDDVETIYAFWRDPIDRYISMVNFLRSPTGMSSFIRLDPERFDNKLLIDDIRTDIAVNTPPEEIFDVLINNPRVPPYVFKPQSHWIDGNPKLQILQYSDFDNELMQLAVKFNIDTTDLVIPKINESNKITDSISPELEAKVREYYADDFNLV